MYCWVVLLAGMAAVASARPQFGTPFRTSPPRPPVPVPPGGYIIVPIISQTQEGPNLDGSYRWSYESGNGITAQEEGVQKPAPEGPGTAARGAFHFVSPEGQDVSITYTSDENGFQAVGPAIPTPPPIPPEILKALEYNAAHPEEDGLGPVAPVPFRG